ncbi:hypothetical protein SAY86_023276 [Trapa natans]|uniref:EEF1A lysine methyltransferase 4 n=1 Tax=Trapa natans TaxID=22666 RepID=A0AAN7RA17_TRANT|nr:hypothetical protein SAY86_023276 [Trapa natans]
MERAEEHSKRENRDSGASTALDYLNPQYWDERFSSEEHYEWFKDYSHFRHLIQQHVEPDSKVLELGCGNSQLSEDLYRDGISNITCIDLSAVAVEKMQQRLLSKGYREIKVVEADMLDLPFTNELFDVVIEKGTMDVLFVDSGDPWNPNPETAFKVMTMLRQVHRVLKPNGTFISVTFGQPHFRRRFFDEQEFTWSVEWGTFGDGFHYFVYVLKKVAPRQRTHVNFTVKRLLLPQTYELIDACLFNSQGKRLLEGNGHSEKVETPSINLFHEELEGEDYLFRTNIDELNH